MWENRVESRAAGSLLDNQLKVNPIATKTSTQIQSISVKTTEWGLWGCYREAESHQYLALVWPFLEQCVLFDAFAEDACW